MVLLTDHYRLNGQAGQAELTNASVFSDSDKVEQSSWYSTQQGFTLIELMISLVLGLLISAAALQVFYISQRTATTQRSASSVQDSAVFGLQLLEEHILLANLGADKVLNKLTPKGGVVLTQDNATTITDTDLRTKANAGNSKFGTAIQSDQLTIQFAAPQAMYDCEGTSITAGTQVIQRYFLRADGSRLSLACDSNQTSGFGTAGVVLISNVDQFKVLLMTSTGYKTITAYNAAASPGDSIQGVKLGLVLSGETPTIEAANAGTINLLGTDLTLPSDSKNTVRRVYEPTLMFRNTRL